jgi:phage gp46-like protein
MSHAAYWVIIVLGGSVLGYFLFRAIRGIRAYFKLRGARLVTCPENQQTAAVEVDAKQAAREAMSHAPQMRLSECSRWPERKDCGQQCLSQIELAPEDCLVRNIVINWFTDKNCVLCSRSIAEVKEWWVDHQPALLTPDKKMIFWNEFPAEQLPELFSKCAPVCWSCNVTEKFRREHPELVTDREPSDLRIRYIK